MQRIVSVVLRRALLCAVFLEMWPLYAHGQDSAIQAGPNLHLLSKLIPVPPRQSAAWQAPETTLSKSFVSATAVLFRQGLADPRGCEYRQIEVVVGGFEPPWTDKIVKTHGWVMPDAGTKTQRFGICWNGLVYFLASVGKPADVRADASVAAKGKVAGALVGTGRTWVPSYEDFCICHPSQQRSVSYESPLPIKACLLLRLGEAGLAEKLWNRWVSGLRSYSLEEERFRSIEKSVEVNRLALKDPYLALANCWTLSLFDQAVSAHMRSDDNLALVCAEMLDTLWPAVVTEAEKRGFRKPSNKEELWLRYFLLDADRARDLLADQRRRAENRKKGIRPLLLSSDFPDTLEFWWAITQSLYECPDKNDRIALLINELEENSDITCGGDPDQDASGLFRNQNILVWLLCKQGEDAVEPLLTCLESDMRLTRFQRSERRYPYGVYRFAYGALSSILKMPFHEGDPMEPTSYHAESKSRQARAARIRAYWKRYKGLPPAERWYGVLADDEAQPYQWLAAACAIVEPVRVPATLDPPNYGLKRDWWRLIATRKMQGEVLRSKIEPSVAELMAMRVEALNGPYRGLLVKRRKLNEQIEKLGEEIDELRDTPEYDYERAEKQLEELERQRDDMDHLIQSGDLEWSTSFQYGCDMALCLAQWDRLAGGKILQEQVRLCRQAAADNDWFKEYLTRLVGVCTNAGDRQAADELQSGSTR